MPHYDKHEFRLPKNTKDVEVKGKTITVIMHRIEDKETEHRFIKQVIRENKEELFKHLLQNGIETHHSDIYIACQYGHMGIARIMLNSGRMKS